MKYYAVKNGKVPGIYESWDECKEQVLGYENAIYKSFSSIEDAKNFIEDKQEVINSNNPFAYIDGSFDPATGNYSFGAVLVCDNQETRFNKKYDADDYSKHRNVAGEIKGAGFIIQYAINHDIKELDIYYDYKGIECWYTGEWKANEPISKVYQEFAASAKNKIKINFVKVKSHTNIYYNDVVDLLAKEALGIS